MAFWKYSAGFSRLSSVLLFHWQRPPKIGLVRFGVDGAAAPYAELLVGRHLDLDLARDCSCNFALQSQRVVWIAFLGFGPKVPVGRGVQQVGSDVHAVF